MCQRVQFFKQPLDLSFMLTVVLLQLGRGTLRLLLLQLGLRVFVCLSFAHMLLGSAWSRLVPSDWSIGEKQCKFVTV